MNDDFDPAQAAAEQEAHSAWLYRHAAAARKEGWSIFDCSGSDNGRWQICRIDSPDDDEGELESDRDAWDLVAKGTEPHHVAARDFIRAHNDVEWRAFCDITGYRS